MYQATNRNDLAALLSHEYGDDAINKADAIREIWHADNYGQLEAACDTHGGDLRDHLHDHRLRLLYWPSLIEAKRLIINNIGRFHGERYQNGRWYCDAGDIYAETIIFSGDKLYLSTQSDIGG